MQALSKSSIKFLDSVEAQEIKEKLFLMVKSGIYNTGSSYSADDTTYPDGLIPFVDKHMNYLNSHPKLDPGMYLANLRLMTRVR